MSNKRILNKSLVLGIIILFIGMTIIPSTGEILSDKQENIKINPLMKKLFNQAVTSVDDGKLYPGIYKFYPCDPIDVNGIGTVSKDESTVVCYLHEGTAFLNNTYTGEFIEWEIGALGTFGEFTGVCEGSNDLPFKPMSVTGRSDYALFMESSYMLEMRIDKEKYERGVEIPVKIKRMIFPYMKIRDLDLINPHFYVLMMIDETEEAVIIYDEEIQTTWNLPVFGSKMWYWNQKDYSGLQVPDGNYSVVAEFEIDGRIHPIFGSGFEIVEDLSRNFNFLEIFIYKILGRFPNAFPIIRHLLEL